MLTLLLSACLLGTAPEDIYRAAIESQKVDQKQAIRLLQREMAVAKRSRRQPSGKMVGILVKDHNANLPWSAAEIHTEIDRIIKGGEIHFLLNPHQLRVGDAGYLIYGVEVRQIIDHNTMLAAPIAEDQITEPFLLKGVSTEGLADKSNVRIACPIAVTKTTAYTTVLGVSKTVLVLKAVSLKDVKPTADPSSKRHKP